MYLVHLTSFLIFLLVNMCFPFNRAQGTWGTQCYEILIVHQFGVCWADFR